MNIILRADPDEFSAIEQGVRNRIEVNKEVRDFLLQQESDRAVVMTGYPLRPVSIEKKISSILLDTAGRSWVVFAVDCSACVRGDQHCTIICDGVNYEKKD